MDTEHYHFDSRRAKRQDFTAWRNEWLLLTDQTQSPKIRRAAMKRYNAYLLDYMRYMRVRFHDKLKKKRNFSPRNIDVVYEDFSDAQLNLTDVYSDLVPAADVDIDSLDDEYEVKGLGVPLVGIIPAEMTKKAGIDYAIRSKGTARTLTAVMDFSSPRPRLHLLSRFKHERFKHEKTSYLLSANYTAALEVYWRVTDPSDWRVLGMFRPGKIKKLIGLSCVESYDPNRIPVILTHGLFSTPKTFNQMVNRLLINDRIRRHYQFWYFTYATGDSWTDSAAKYRHALAEIRRQVDPHHSNKNWDRKVLVGHSMGGLITHYSQALEPWKMIAPLVTPEARQKYLCAKYIDQPFTSPSFERFRRNHFFRPVPAGRIVYMAPPHRGAPLADYYLSTLIASIIKLPEDVIRETVKVVTLHDDILLLHPKRLTDWFTSTSQLSPSNPFIKGLTRLRVQDVPTHSIIGDKGDNDSPNSSDGAVPYWSSHINWGTESIVPCSHSVQKEKETAEDMRRILLDYLDELKLY